MRVERALVGLMCVAAVTGTGCGGKLAYNLPPSSRLMEPGPGVGGPGPGVIPPMGSPNGIYGGGVGRFGGPGGGGGYMMGGGYGECAQNGPAGPGMAPMGAPGMAPMGAPAGVMQASYNAPGGAACSCCSGSGESCEFENDYVQPTGFANCGPGGGRLHGLFGNHGMMRPGSTEAYADGGAFAGMPTSQIAFLGDEGVMVSWDVGGYGMFDSSPIVIPGRQDFYQGAIYRLRVSNIPGRAGVELFPTLEVAPVTPRTDAYLAHSPIPVQFTEEDFDQVLSGNFVTKVIYLPDPEFQELALAGVETLVSTRLDPGVDPIVEADRRGSILAILRMGNKDLRQGGGVTSPEYEPELVVPASHEEGSQNANGEETLTEDTLGEETQAMYNQELDATGAPTENGIVPAQYCGPYGDGSMGAGMPMGMPTGGFAPPVVPPNMVAGAPQWGMPITGTPIGLPGPPHIPLGVPAGLQKHIMKNRTRVLLPPPVSQVNLSVKQRPGMNYPRPVTHVHVDETQREPLRLFPGWLSGMFSGNHGNGGMGHGGMNAANCQ
jgi:hypothetical protein